MNDGRSSCMDYYEYASETVVVPQFELSLLLAFGLHPSPVDSTNQELFPGNTIFEGHLAHVRFPDISDLESVHTMVEWAVPG